MSASPSRLPREDEPSRQGRRAAQRRAVRALRQRQTAQGLAPRATATIANSTSAWETVAEEREARQAAIDAQVTVYRAVLPDVLAQFAHIRDPRHPTTVRHTTTTLLLYGMLAFVFQMASRREANRQMTMPLFQAQLRLLFPEVETLPHSDTLHRLLSGIDVDQIETALLAVVARFLRQKKFTRHQVAAHYPIAIDGTPPRSWARIPRGPQ